MLGFLRRMLEKREKEREKAVTSLNTPLEQIKMSPILNDNIAVCRKIFADMDIVSYKEVVSDGRLQQRYFLVFCDGMIDREIVNDNLITPLMQVSPDPDVEVTDALRKSIINICDACLSDSFKEVVEAVTSGDTAVFAEGCDKAVILNTRECAGRAVQEPENEKVIGGPKEGFTEGLLKNLSLVIKRVRSNELKTKLLTVGRVTETRVCICYLENVVNKNILNDVIKKIQSIEIDGVLDSNYIVELIRDNRLSPFRTVGYTERPDSLVAKLLEGRIAIMVDGTPMVLTLPYLFIENFQSSEDYYFSFYYSSFSRMLRMAAFLLTISIPAFYIAIVAYHQEMLPLPLLIRIAMEQQRVPFPAAIEAVIMLLIFDVLRETGVRMPSSIGQTLSIVGALVIGQAAVEASLVSAPMIIVVASTGITSLLVPKLNSPIVVYRFFFLLLAATFGFFGLAIGFSIMIIHINNLTSFTVEQTMLDGTLKLQNLKDIFVRSPWHTMKERPDRLTDNLTRKAGEN
jgi:spore germination protein KA